MNRGGKNSKKKETETKGLSRTEQEEKNLGKEGYSLRKSSIPRNEMKSPNEKKGRVSEGRVQGVIIISPRRKEGGGKPLLIHEQSIIMIDSETKQY